MGGKDHGGRGASFGLIDRIVAAEEVQDHAQALAADAVAAARTSRRNQTDAPCLTFARAGTGAGTGRRFATHGEFGQPRVVAQRFGRVVCCASSVSVRAACTSRADVIISTVGPPLPPRSLGIR